MFNKKYIKRVFYVHTEAAFAVFLLCSALVEVLCALVVGEPFSYFAYASAALFLAMATALVLNIYRWEKKWSRI